ncbi:DUF6114 domain-containing protein [Vulcanisaeta distributa]|uniref:Transmembrane protein n=1 Tax=Vulcanisaeta distributa (strain DSM 14429 / JCM 11212 / NBRC 100878 / IC-017) TaxID=572478 RepID=E1QT85_VULDI|nr:DUF6114 domain-containing protein [Vulcanisaeta distributa]ADN49677.1 hypothetical protein Vdis_0268 [Vulcanisaeta distributa DSM 14429]
MDFFTKFGYILVNMWRHKALILPILLVLNVLSWIYFWVKPSLLGFSMIILALALLLTVVFIGVIPVAIIEENNYRIDVVRRMGLDSFVSLVVVYALFIYVSLILLAVIKPPPLLIVMMVLLFALPLTPFVVIAVLVPPLVGYFMRQRWRSLRGRIPFWGIYLGLLSALILLLLPIMYFRVLFVSASLVNSFILGGVVTILSLIPLFYPKPMVCRVLGLAMIFLGILMWLIVAGGLTWGSVLSIISGGYLYDWKPQD